eukprot:scaffold2646_cov226-Pinguiococcus_pyrenoidosus.AAC.1
MGKAVFSATHFSFVCTSFRTNTSFMAALWTIAIPAGLIAPSATSGALRSGNFFDAERHANTKRLD